MVCAVTLKLPPTFWRLAMVFFVLRLRKKKSRQTLVGSSFYLV